jgi:hypothetical protein
MTLSVHPSVAWLYAAEQGGGGISAWNNAGRWQPSYQEVTGYLLPTMIKWDAGDLAERCAGFLLRVQNRDGGFNGIDGIPRPFDTSAVIEGLMCMYAHTAEVKYYKAAYNATEWMQQHITKDGYLANSPTNREPCVYNLRASAIIQNRREMDYWKQRGLIADRERAHYLAYALEGALNFGETDFAMQYLELAYKNRLQPFYVDHSFSPLFADFDVCASAQMAILFHRVGMDASRHYEAVKHHIHANGGVPQSVGMNGQDGDGREISWAAKFVLDLTAVMEGVKA